MEVLKITLKESKDNQLRIITESPTTKYDYDIDFNDGYPEVAMLTRNHLLGVIASINWSKWVERVVYDKAVALSRSQ